MKGNYSNMGNQKEIEKKKVLTPFYQSMSNNNYYGQQYTPNSINYSHLNPGSNIPTFPKKETPATKPVAPITTTITTANTTAVTSKAPSLYQ